MNVLAVCPFAFLFFPFVIHSVDVWAHGSWIQMDGMEFVARIPVKVFHIVVRLRDEDLSHAQQHTININTADERHTQSHARLDHRPYITKMCV